MFNSITELMEAKAYPDKRAISWNRICEEEALSEEFIRANSGQVNWYLVSGHQVLSEAFIREFSHRLYWHAVAAEQMLSESFIEEFSQAAKWQPALEGLTKRQVKTFEKEGREFDDKKYWTLISMKKNVNHGKGLSPAFIEKHQDRLSWKALSLFQKLPMSLIDRHPEKVDWNSITRNQCLTERFIEKYRHLVEWETISFHQNLSERFINRHHSKMNYISAEKERSEGFLYNHLEKMDAASVVAHQNLRNVKKYEPFTIFVIEKNGLKKYIIKFHENEESETDAIRIAEDEELYEQLEENGLDAVIEEDFPELILSGFFKF
ncbi:hypothetical protein BN1080_03240 [Planococcus massiliensis]|uniref:Uncharacterized protein n=1 Tax=Planococcus massiliensis TaxID=1499687 RepID=A0A098EPL4_9BACL|nr:MULTISPECIES: hypothetical protein [Planococcus]MCJ1909656.1 hypothetical protein [Planococcus ruber]CEG24219.1 hypothetical protein BN1080_03240 [Planococcus massiliensis]